MRVSLLAFSSLTLVAGLFCGCKPAGTAGGDDSAAVSQEPSGEASADPVARDVTIDEAAALVQGEDAVTILDVRTPEEFAQGHLAGAVNIDVKNDSFAAEIAGLDKDKPYLVHCRSGNRSRGAMEQLKAAGFTQLYHMKDGMLGWQGAGKPVETN